MTRPTTIAGGQELAGIRLDSGDLAYLSNEARKLLDEAGFADTVIVSGSSDERPLLPFGTAWLPKGEEVRVVAEEGHAFDFPKPLFASLQPIRHEELHERIVPQELRMLPGYEGHRLTVRTARLGSPLHGRETSLNEDFRLIEHAD